MNYLDSLSSWLVTKATDSWSVIPWLQGQSYDWGWGGHPMMWGAWGGMMIMMLLFWALIIVAVVLGIRWLLGQGKQPGFDSALEILRQRYARERSIKTSLRQGRRT